MTLKDATMILHAHQAIDDRSLAAFVTPPPQPTMRWEAGALDVFLHGRFTADTLEAIVVWMRHHQEEAR